MDKAKKEAVIKEFAQSANDVGSADVQIALLTNHIKELSGHLESHVKDNSSRRGLVTMVNRRRRLLAYLKREAPARYMALIKKLELRH